MVKIKNKKGFTVTEFVILSAMLMILGFALSAEVMNAVDTARQKKSITSLREWGTALGAYYSDYNFYPYMPLNGPVGPGVFIYTIFTQKKYLESNLYQDGWYNNLWYTAGGINMQTAQGYTIASLGKGDQFDTNPIPSLRCFQCDIRLRNGEFFTYPVGKQVDSPDGITCPNTCQISAYD